MARDRNRRLRSKYGITLAEKEARIASQGGFCANPGCNEPILVGTANTDHNHETNAVRGELCRGCNIALGLLKESRSRMRGLALYLEKY